MGVFFGPDKPVMGIGNSSYIRVVPSRGSANVPRTDIRVTVDANNVATPAAMNDLAGDVGNTSAKRNAREPIRGAAKGTVGDAVHNGPVIMAGAVAYLSGDRGYIRPDEGGEHFFFWARGNGIKLGDKVNFQFDPNAAKVNYH